MLGRPVDVGCQESGEELKRLCRKDTPSVREFSGNLVGYCYLILQLKQALPKMSF